MKTEEMYYAYKGANINISKIQFKQAMIDFAKFHVEEALKNASEKAELRNIPGPGNRVEVYNPSILEAYSLDNIK